MANRIEYGIENLGKRDPIYGGVLTDIGTLPVGATFNVRNGFWDGEIVMKDGKKAVAAYNADRQLHGSSKSRRPVNIAILSDDPSDNILSISDLKLPETL